MRPDVHPPAVPLTVITVPTAALEPTGVSECCICVELGMLYRMAVVARHAI